MSTVAGDRRTDIAATELRAKNLADLYDLAPLDWAAVRRALETNLTQAPDTGGPGHHTFWLSTIDADGGPHRATRVTDDEQLQRLAEVFAEGGWAPTVADGGFSTAM